MTRLSRLLSLPPAERWLVIEAAICLVLAKTLLRILPFRKIASILGDTKASGETGTAKHQEIAASISHAMAQAQRGLPWQSTCLTQALAGRLMLGRRTIPCTVHIGVGKSDPANQFMAHAWLRVEDVVVTGAFQADRYTPIATFAHRVQG